MGRNKGVYKNGYNTWLSSRLQNQPRSFRFVLINFSLCLYVRRPDRLLKILRVRQSNISRILSHSTQNVRVLSDAVLICTAQGYDYHRLPPITSVLFLPFIALFSNGFRTQNRKYSVSGSRIVSRKLSHATQNI